MISIVFAVLFLVVLFLQKNTTLFQKSLNFIQGKQESGLVYESNITLGELVDKDTDGDGISDWEEPLHGLDPAKKETIPGVPDSTTLAKIKADQGSNVENENKQDAENLTETDKFSRELFSTVSTLSQNGEIDQTTIDKITSSLSEHIKTSTPRKIFTISDIKVIKDDGIKSIKSYQLNLNNIFNTYHDKETVADVLDKFIIDENNVDATALKELSPIIEQTKKSINAILKMNIPESVADFHLAFLNSGERLLENMIDMQLYETDSLIAMSAMSKYQENVDSFNSAVKNLASIIANKLNN